MYVWCSKTFRKTHTKYFLGQIFKGNNWECPKTFSAPLLWTGLRTLLCWNKQPTGGPCSPRGSGSASAWLADMLCWNSCAIKEDCSSSMVLPSAAAHVSVLIDRHCLNRVWSSCKYRRGRRITSTSQYLPHNRTVCCVIPSCSSFSLSLSLSLEPAEQNLPPASTQRGRHVLDRQQGILTQSQLTRRLVKHLTTVIYERPNL